MELVNPVNSSLTLMLIFGILQKDGLWVYKMETLTNWLMEVHSKKELIEVSIITRDLRLFLLVLKE